MATHKDTTTQVLQRIEAKLNNTPPCVATTKEYDDHCEFINDAKVILPQFTKAIKDFEVALKEGQKSFTSINTRLTVIETEKKTAIAVIGIVAGVIGGGLSLLVGLLIKYI